MSGETVIEKVGMTADEFHSKSKIEQVSIAILQVDRSYQRDVSITMVDEIATNWDEVAAELILVSNRGERDESAEVGGGLWIVNGQHRTAAAQKIGLKKIWARVIDLTEVENPVELEAKLRLKTNVRLGDRPLERFKAQLAAGDTESLHIVRILEKFDTEVNTTPLVDQGINAISSVEDIYRIDHGALLNETLEIIRDAFDRVGGATATSNMLKGVAWFIEKHQDEADRGRFVSQIRTIGLAALERRARMNKADMGGSLWVNFYRVFISLYNERLAERNRLEMRTRGSQTLGKRQGGGRFAWDK